jgi:membrane fusion protein (multidrug efflux system)
MNDGSAIAETAAPAADRKPGRKRLGLMLLAPVALVAAGAVYLLSGRYVATDNAYIRADIANISPEVSGTVQAVMVRDNQAVKAGDVLVKLDDTNYRILLAGADANLKSTAAAIDADRIDYRQHLQDLKMAQSELEFAQRQYDRQFKLAATSAGAESARDAAERSLKVARDKVALVEEEIQESLARLFGDPEVTLERHPRYQEGLAQQAVARLQIERAEIKAPFDGVVSHVPQVGDYARMGVSLLTLVSTDKVWIEANFKETELTNMRPGQLVEVTIDTYPGTTWRGSVESIAQATGAEFSLLPPQNATGNWVKVVQRVPVRIALASGGPESPLRAGLSVEATVDTGRRRIDAWLKP